jgi:uncharacterized membrane protein
MQRPRLTFVDLLRGGALLVMIETHVFNTFLISQLKETSWFHMLSFINGLVAPSFLFVSGFVFIFGTRAKAEGFRTFGPAFWKQMRRIGLIWGIGYAMHPPYRSFKRVLEEATHEDWLRFYRVDILHCIAFGLLLLLISVIVIKSEALRRHLTLIAGLATVLVAPLVWRSRLLQSAPAPIAAYLSDQHYSLFSLFPWLGYLLMGAAAGSMYMERTAEGRERGFMHRIACIGIGVIVLAFLLSFLPGQHEYISTGWRASPVFFAIRLGCVLLLLYACWQYATRRPIERSFVLDISRESLFVYTAHLAVLYSLSWKKITLAKAYGGSFGVIQCALASLALIGLMVLGAKLWGGLKRRSVRASKFVFYAFVATVAILFFAR